MTPYLQVISRLLQSFGYINKSTNFEVLFSPVPITEITSKEDQLDESDAPLPTTIRLFSFKEAEDKKAELELDLLKDKGILVNGRVQIFFQDIAVRDRYFDNYIRPFFSQRFGPIIQTKKHLGFEIIEYKSHGLSIGINYPPDIPFISAYVTIEGFE
jgi:hypothetical protein